MIHTVTFNPALDITGTVDELVPNEKSYVSHEIYVPGGNGINAGIIASRLAGPVTLHGFVGGNNGAAIKKLLRPEKLKDQFIRIKNNSRINITISQKNTGKQTRLSFTGPKISQSEWNQFSRRLLRQSKSGDVVLLGGSLPPGVTPTQVGSLLKQLKQKDIFCMADMPSSTLKTIIKSRPSFIKPNLKEFQELTGSKAVKIEEVIQQIKKLHKYVDLICVSSVDGGALLSDGQQVWFGKTPKLAIRSQVGAGDSLVGAMAKLLEADPQAKLSDLLRHGLAASSATLTEPGLTLGSASAIKKYVSKIKLRDCSNTL